MCLKRRHLQLLQDPRESSPTDFCNTCNTASLTEPSSQLLDVSQLIWRRRQWSEALIDVLHAKLLQSCLTLWDSMNCSPWGSSVCGLLRKKYWGGLPCPPPGGLPDPGMEPVSPVSCTGSQVLYQKLVPPGKPDRCITDLFCPSTDEWIKKLCVCVCVCVCVYLEPICFLSTLGNLKKKGWTSPDFIMNFPWLFLFLSTLFLNFFFNIYFGCIKS